ncbi:MAG: hypothetical protein WAT92_00390 [Saprospiraceae bacterium]
MITNFESITYELTEDEMKHVNGLILALKLRTKETAIKSPEIVKSMNIFAERHNICRMTDARLRKCINYIRSNSILPVIATSRGYYVSYDIKELSDQIKSLTERANSILDCVFGLNKILNR